LLAYGTGQPMQVLPKSEATSLCIGNTNEIILAGSGGAVAFTLTAVLLSSP